MEFLVPPGRTVCVSLVFVVFCLPMGYAGPCVGYHARLFLIIDVVRGQGRVFGGGALWY